MIWGGHAMDDEEEEEAEENGEGEKQEEVKPKPKEPTTSQRKSSVVPAANQARKTSSAAAHQPKTALSSLSSTMNSTSRSSSLTGGPQNVVAKKRFEGKVAIVTESNCGIDRATAIMLGKEGAKVTVHGTDEGELRRTVIQMIRADVDQHDILVVQGAIENDDTLKNLVERTIKKFGRIDILVNNAGAITNNQQNNNNSHSRHPHNGGGEDDDEDEDSSSGGNPLRHRRKSTYHKNSMFFDDDGPSHNFDLLFNINLKSITKLTRFCVPYLEDTKGAVVNVSSFGSQQAFSDYAYYSTAKTALDNYCRSVAIKYATRNIRVNNVNPGFITSEHGDDTETHVNKFYLNWIKNHVPMGRGGTAEEIAKVIVFLASDDASYVTGATIVADGAVSIYSKPADFF